MFSISVKIDSIESRKRSAGLLHIVIGFFLIAKGTDYFRLMKYTNFIWVLPVLLIASFSLFYGFFRKKTDPTASLNFTMRLLQFITFLVLGIVMVHYGTYIDYTALFIFAFLCFVLLFSERKVFNDTYIILDNNGIKIPGYYKDHQIPWNALSNVVVREDFITIFHVKQKYLQYQVMQTLSPLELAKMNAYCKEQIEQVTLTSESNK
jgi:hypothetical protein